MVWMLRCFGACAQRAGDKKNSSLENKRVGAGAWLQVHTLHHIVCYSVYWSRISQSVSLGSRRLVDKT